MKINLKLLLAIISLSFLSVLSAKTLELSPESKVGFSIIKFKIGSPVEGKFTKYTGTLDYEIKKHRITNVNVEIETASVDTGIADRDKHLANADFFDSEKIKFMTFKSTSPVVAQAMFKLPGVLTIKGVSKPVVLDVTRDQSDLSVFKFKATTKINRLDFGVSWNAAMEQSDWKTVFGKLGKMVLDEEVTINLDVTLVEKK